MTNEQKLKLTRVIVVVLVWLMTYQVSGRVTAAQVSPNKAAAVKEMMKKMKLPAERRAAARRARAMGLLPGVAKTGTAMLDPGGTPHYFGPYANWAYSPLPRGPVTGIELISGGFGYTDPDIRISDVYGTGSGATATATVINGVIVDIRLENGGSGYTAPIVIIADSTGKGAEAVATIGELPGSLTGGIRKFVDSLPGLGENNANNLGQYIPIAVPDTQTYPGCDYYEIELREYSEKMHSDLPPTRLRGYVQVRNGVDVAPIHYMGPMIIAHRDRPVRIKFTNKLPTGKGGNLFIPVDTTVMGAGMGPKEMPGMPGMMEMYTQNRAGIHLHGNNTVWISDGTPHQWITPAGEQTSYPKGVSVVNVPDMPDPGDGSMTLYYTNEQSARLMFYHDHAYGITRLNVYAGMAAPYVVTDSVEQALIDQGIIPADQIPIIIQDKTFVDASTIAAQDPTWDWGTTAPVPNTGDLWMPHVYMPNQNPWNSSGMNAFGRWHYGPWFWPPTVNIEHGPVPNPYYNPAEAPWEPPMIPGVPDNSMAMEAFMDTPIVNGTAYPYLEVDPKAYRFRILNAADDRFLNLQLYVADDTVVTADGRTKTEVRMIPASASEPNLPQYWPTDGREGGVPDPAYRGPDMIQIGNEGGFLPKPVVLENKPVAWNLDQTNFDFGLVNQGTLILGTAERADVIVDFSQYRGKTLILYNDAPAPFPAIDPRYDYYTGCPSQMDVGGAPTTQPGYGPNTRTIMQIRVRDVEPEPPFNLAALEEAWKKTDSKPGVFESLDQIIVPDARYNSAYNQSYPVDQYVRIYQNTHTFRTVSGEIKTFPLEPKAIQDEMGEAFDKEYGRMSGFLGLELPFTVAGTQNFVLYPFASPPVEIIKGTTYGTPLGVADDGTQFWKITHNGVDTHTIHTHLFNVQLVNRVAWDNAIRPPDDNELGWKETVRVNPLQDTIVAFRPTLPKNLPFKVPNSIRPIDPTMPLGASLTGGPAGFFDPLGTPVAVTNHLVNYGWEYVYHCHLLAHEEMDMMHAMAIAVAPDAPSSLAASLDGNGSNKRVILTWRDNSINETSFTIQRATSPNFTSGLTTLAVTPENVTTYTDSIGNTSQTYYYRVFATNTVGDTWDYTDAGIGQGAGFPTKTARSAFSNTAVVGPGQEPPAAPSNLRITYTGRTSISIAWNDNSNNEDGFLVQRARNNSFSQGLMTFSLEANTMAFTDVNLSPNTRYYYRVRAFNASGNSAFSNTVNARTAR